MNKQELEDRLINFASNIIIAVDKIDKNYAGNHLANQIIRSGTSLALNYSEAQSAESTKDYIHKMELCLKELKDSVVFLKIIEKTKLMSDTDGMQLTKMEANELILVFETSIKNAKKDYLRLQINDFRFQMG
jgi:four helix bundle protein